MVKQTIAIVGAEGKMGSFFAHGLAPLNLYRLLLLSEDEGQLDKLSRQILLLTPEADVELISCLKDGCWEADIIILDVPNASIKDVANKIRDVSTQKIVFGISKNENNIHSPITAAQEWQQLLPNAKVVVALNNLNTTKTLIAGNDEESVLTIAGITKKLGFQPIITGSLSTIKTL